MKLINDDCVKAMKQLVNENIKVDLTVTSPPYDNLRTYNECEWDFNVFKKVAELLYDITKDGGVVVWIVNDATINGSETGTSFKQALYFKEIGFNLHDTMIYKKKGITYPETNRYYPNFEYMFVLSKGKPKTVHLLKDRINKTVGLKNTCTERQTDGSIRKSNAAKKGKITQKYGVRYNIWEYATGHMKSAKEKIAFKHPAIAPVKLVEDHIRSWSDEEDLVLDCFMGSGTTAVACQSLNRKFIGIEIDKEYYEIATERLKQYKTQIKLI